MTGNNAPVVATYRKEKRVRFFHPIFAGTKAKTYVTKMKISTRSPRTAQAQHGEEHPRTTVDISPALHKRIPRLCYELLIVP